MPIYAYQCESCGHTKDVLQKMSDAPLTQCPACGAETFKKQLTAAGFQLKGSGWYVTDFKGGAASAAAVAPATGEAGDKGAAKAESASTAAAGQAAPAAASKESAAAPAAASTSKPASSGEGA